MKITTTLVRSGVLFAVMIVFCSSAASAQPGRRQLTYGPETVSLTGRLVLRTFYGPPNFGESPKTDARETQSVLLLDAAVDVIGSGHNPFEETERRVTRITLVLDKPVKDLIGRRVTVQGPLFHAHTGHHHTRVLMMVSSMKKR